MKARKFLQNRWLNQKTPEEKKQNVWVCVNHPECEHAVFAIPGGTMPLGTMADNRTRFVRHQAHLLMNALWKNPGEGFQLVGYSWRESRKRAYLWLSTEMGLAEAECHFGMFNEAQCVKAMSIIQKKIFSGQPPIQEPGHKKPIAEA